MKSTVYVKHFWTGKIVPVEIDKKKAKSQLKRVIKHPEKYRNPELIAEFLNHLIDR